MTLRSAVGALVGGLGVVIGIVGIVVAAVAVLVALGLPADSRADEPPLPAIPTPPAELVIALGLADPALQAGVVRGDEVILARGLEVEIARELGRRLGAPRVRFVYVRSASRLLAAGARPWDLAIASVRPTRAASEAADLSDPYLATDQAVVLRRGQPPLTRLAGLRTKLTCAVRGSDGARSLAAVAPRTAPRLAPSTERLLRLVETGACDAALVDAAGVGRLVSGRGSLLGPINARIASGSGYVLAVTRGGPVSTEAVSRALRRMRADGTMHRLARTWLRIDPARLRPLS